MGISFIMMIVVFLFNSIIEKNLGLTCSHGPTCGMYDSLAFQTKISFVLVGVIFIIGLWIMFIKPKEKVIVKKVKERKKKIDLTGLNSHEKEAIKILQSENGAIFQKTLMEKLNIGKVGITRLIDKLEAKQIVERKRRGMNNIVVLKS